jgi:hypothetical protein
MADRYTYDQFEGCMARSRDATPAELAQARDYLIQILQANNVPYAFVGGYSLVLRGSQRPTNVKQWSLRRASEHQLLKFAAATTC